MARRGRRKAGLMREDAARDAMRAFGFEERVIKVCIKELLQLYGESGWILIEEFSYSVLLNKCLEKQAEQEQAAEEEEEMAEEQNVEMAQEEQEEEEQQVENERDHVGSNSTALCGAETGEVVDYAHHSARGAKRCGWLDAEETDPEGDSVVVGDDDDEMIRLTPEPLCEELTELLAEVLGEKKRKRPTRWDT
ncbi:hypothetical protein Bca4012_018031 [Brassica carinata]|uniref:WIYLD domain-containing protein n=1 Tax=Brassica carinata TaxID=52824 RepID=A0A8X7WLF9_BRACI|nr:hypothetical protein Bca52824_003596 [Brassica carinata]